MMKLGWKMTLDPMMLRARISKARYKCRSGRIPGVIPHRNQSNVWKGISNKWEEVEKNLIWTINNRNRVKIWKDYQVPKVGKLFTVTLCPLIEIEEEMIVVHFVGLLGGWNWNLLKSIPPENICNVTSSIQPPPPKVSDNNLAQSGTLDGQFTLKLVYCPIAEEEENHVGRTYLVWRLKCPKRVKTCLRLVDHDGLLTK